MRAPITTKTRELIEEGAYVATVYRIIYIGTEEVEFKGQKNKLYKVDITWELNNEMKVWKEGDEPKPAVISKSYTLSMGPKSNLRPIVEGIVGGLTDFEANNFDLDDLLGKVCLLNITHGTTDSGKKYEKVSTSKMMKGIELPKPFNKQYILSYYNWNEELYQALPQWIREKMSATPEYQNMRSNEQAHGPETIDMKKVAQSMPKIEYGEELAPGDIPF